MYGVPIQTVTESTLKLQLIMPKKNVNKKKKNLIMEA